MNKHLHNSLRALFLSLAVLLSLPMLAVDIEGIEYWLDFETRQAAVHGDTWGYSGHIVIPETVEYEGTKFSVTRIMEQAFYGCSDLTSITIPSSLTSIGKQAFYDCYGLTSLYLSDIAAWCNVTFEGDMTSRPMRYAKHVYINGEEPKDLLIPDNVTSIGEHVFYNWSCLNSVTIPNSVTSIGDWAFSGCSGLTSVTIPNSLTSIGRDAFSGCSGLTSVTIPNSVTSIGIDAFYGCSGLTSVTIPNSVTSIVSGAFSGCSGLTSVTIGNSVKSIEEGAFYGCTSLKSITIPNSVESIKDEAFSGCSSLASLTIGNGVKSLMPFAFEGCSGLTSIVVEEGNTVYDSRNNCNAIIATATNALLRGCENTVIPNSVTSIGYGAFHSCSGLTSVTIPNSVTSIYGQSFQNCSNLLDVYCYAENVPYTDDNAFYSSPIEYATLHVPNASINSYKATAPWSSFKNIVAITTEVDGINYDFDAETKQATVIAKSSGKYSGEVVIPESVVYEGTEYSVTSIGENAFEECTGLTSVTIPNSVTSIGRGAFYACSGLTSVTIPNSVTSIGNYAFSYCTGLTSVHISDIAAWCNIDFDHYETNPLYYAEHLYLNGEEVKDLVIPNSVTSIGDYAFRGCSGLTSVTIPNSVTSIGGWAFGNCSGLTSVIIGNSVESIGREAFCNCSGLTSVTIPNSVTSIGGWAFGNCSGLTSVTIPNSVTSIGEYAFAHCSELLDVYCYAENVPSTESNAFDGSPITDAILYVPAGFVDSYKTAPWSGFGNIVAISESTNDLVIKDGESFENTEERELGTLTYTRTLPNRYWNPLYVPFKIPYEALKDNYDVAYINSMHSYDNDQDGEIEKMTMEVIKIKKGVLKANHPYLIRAKNEAAKQMDLLLEDVTLYPTVSNKLDCSSVYTHFEITGTYKEMTREDLGGSLVITTDGAWKKLAASSILKPFRFYLTITDREGSPLEVSEDAKSRINICVHGEDDFATGIDEVKSENSNVKTAVYDLSGRRVQKAQKGIFIQNGKLMVK